MVGELNFGLLDQSMPAKIAGSVTGAYQAGQQQDQANALAQAQLQHAQSQNELSKYTLSSAKRADERQVVLDTMMGQGFDPANPQHLAKLPQFGAAGMAILKGIQEGQLNTAKIASEKVKTQGTELENSKKKQEAMAQAYRDISANPSDAQITAHLEDTLASPLFTDAEKAKIQADAQAMLAKPYEARKIDLASRGSTAGDLSSARTSANTLAETSRHNRVGEATSQGQLDVARTNAQTSRGHLAVAQGNAETSRGQLEVARGGLALRQTGLTELPPKEIQKREAKYPAATAAVKEATKGNAQLIKDLEALKTHAGLDGITGVVYGRTPSVAEASREAKAKFDKIMARGGFSELAKMRAASPTGGALGNISDTEGKYLRAAFAAMDPTQSKGSFQKAIDDAVEELKGSNTRLQEAYDMTYEYKQGGATPAKPPAKPTADALSPAEQAELDALRKRFNK